jgi:hypothetical protein
MNFNINDVWIFENAFGNIYFTGGRRPSVLFAVMMHFSFGTNSCGTHE